MCTDQESSRSLRKWNQAQVRVAHAGCVALLQPFPAIRALRGISCLGVMFILISIVSCRRANVEENTVETHTAARNGRSSTASKWSSSRESGAFRFSATSTTSAPNARSGKSMGETKAPFDLTASDGTGLRLVTLDARGVVEAPLAFTELRLTFENPGDRVIEGRFHIALPTGASVSRFAMKIGDRWQEGEVVERQAARRAYEDFLHRKQDPALLEQVAGNEFSARVFPIPAHGRKELIVSYAHELKSSEAYTIPLKGLPEVQRLSIRAFLGRAALASAPSSLGGTTVRQEIVEIEKENWRPDIDFEIAPQNMPDRVGLRHKNLVLSRVVPVQESAADEPDSLFVLLDTSASRAMGFRGQLETVQRLVAALAAGKGENTPVAIGCFDQTQTLCFEGVAGDFDDNDVDDINKRLALGASDLEGALAWLGREKTSSKRYKRLLVVTDGVSTAGVTDVAVLRKTVAKLSTVGFERLDALVMGGIQDREMLSALVTGGLARDGTVIDGAQPIEEVGYKLSQATYSGLIVKVPGARWVWPQKLDGIQGGDEVLVYADLPEGDAFELFVGDEKLVGKDAVLTSTEGSLLERAWVKARIRRIRYQRDTLFADDDDLRAALKKQVVDLSVKYRVLSEYTALLVLETEADYRRFSIDRRALVDIMTVGMAGLEMMARSGDELLFSQRSTGGRRGGKREIRPVVAGAASSMPETSARGAAPVVAQAPSPDPELRMQEDEHNAPPPASMAVAEAIVLPEPEAAQRKAAPRSSVSSVSPVVLPPRDVLDRMRRREVRVQPVEKKISRKPYVGEFAEVMTLLARRRTRAALNKARAWRATAPGDVMAVTALGEAYEAAHNLDQAARAYGSLIDLYPSRADLRRYAGERLERVKTKAALRLAVDTFEKAVKQRPDHPSSHRLYAFALLKLGHYADAFAAVRAGLQQRYPSERFNGVMRILREDLSLIAASWKKSDPSKARDIDSALEQVGVSPETRPSLRFVLYWETDANDVDFHIYDGKGGHASYRQRELSSGGELYADVTSGYGPECFSIQGKARAYPYKFDAHYYSRGPMGYGMGKLQIIEHDGNGELRFEEHPFVVMQDNAFLKLGKVRGKLGAIAYR